MVTKSVRPAAHAASRKVSWASNVLLALASAVLLVVTFPDFNLVYLAPMALTPLIVAAAREVEPWRRFLLGELAGVVYWFGVCYWIQFVLSYHGGLGAAASWGAFLLFCLVKALHMGVFTLLAGYVADTAYAIPAVAALWTGLERTHGPLGFAWLALGNAGIAMSVPMRLAPWTGVYGLSFVFAMLGAALAAALLRRPTRELAWLAVLAGLALLPGLPERRPASEELVVVQPNIALDQVWTPSRVDATRDELAYLSIEAALAAGERRPAMIVWPEVPAPFYYETDPRFQSAANSLARATGTYFLFGTVAYTQEGAPLNSAQLIAPDGMPAMRYDKMFLVPFGEFVPPLFGFIDKITDEAGDFVPGRGVVLGEVNGRKAGVFICYEAVFPHLVRRFARDGAEVLLNLSNDGYFGRSAARAQHLLIARMRAAENRRWLIRSTNNGITVAIDPAGWVRQRLETDVRLAARLRYGYEEGTTFYTRHGDWFGWGCLALGLGLAAAAQWPRHRPEAG